jgi:GNAT superfamily N-acetyltransferase
MPAFYDETQYAGGLLPSDRVVVALSGKQIVGAYRLAREHDVLVLRGMRVRSQHRRQGIGVRLLDALSGLTEPCYCLPLVHLADSLYGRAGFAALTQAETPAFPRERAAEYARRGFDVIVMRREPTAS